MKKILLLLLLPLISFSKENFFIRNANNSITYENYVDEAVSLEERVNTALEYIDLNIDLNTAFLYAFSLVVFLFLLICSSGNDLR